MVRLCGWSLRTTSIHLMGALQGSMASVLAVTFEALLERVDAIHGLGNAREDVDL